MLISQIQGTPASHGSNRFGATDVSPLIGQLVTVEAVVVGDFQNFDSDKARKLDGFYVQEESKDEDDNIDSSEGLYIYAKRSGVDVDLGDVVRVTGTVIEHFGETRLTDIVRIDTLAAGQLHRVAPAVIELAANTRVSVAQGGRYQPDLEAYEGMWVRFADTLTITEQFQLDRFNEIRLIAGARPYQFSQIHSPDAFLLDAYKRAIAARSIVYDDGLNRQNAPVSQLDGFAPYSEASAKRMGDRVQSLTGVLDYKWAGNSASPATWRVRSVTSGTNAFTSTAEGNSPNLRPLSPPAVGGNLKVATLNVQNLFVTLAATNAVTAGGHRPRGAHSPAELERQLQKLVRVIIDMDADVLGLVELENEFDPVNDGSTAIEVLVNALNTAAGEALYDYVYPGQPFAGTDAIAVGLIYQPSAVTLAQNARPALLDDTVAATLPVFAEHDFRRRPIFSGPRTNRTPLAASFTHNDSGESFVVVVNHFKSKSASGLKNVRDINFDQKDGASFWSTRRLDAAMAVTDWLKTAPTGAASDNVIILGDLNAYALEQPVRYLLANGFNNVAGTTVYSYVFDGRIGTLDYLLVSDALSNKLQKAATWHINADEADALDYNLDYGRSAHYFSPETATRSSDHDPVLAGFQLKAAARGYKRTRQLLVNGGQSGIDGASHSRTVSALQLYAFVWLLMMSDEAYQAGEQAQACDLLAGLEVLVDGEEEPKDWLKGPGLTQIANGLSAMASAWTCW